MGWAESTRWYIQRTQTAATGGGYTCLVILSYRERMGMSWEASLSLTVTAFTGSNAALAGFLTPGTPECWPVNMWCGSLLPRVFRSSRRNPKGFHKLFPSLKGGWVAYVVYNTVMLFFFYNKTRLILISLNLSPFPRQSTLFSSSNKTVWKQWSCYWSVVRKACLDVCVDHVIECFK